MNYEEKTVATLSLTSREVVELREGGVITTHFLGTASGTIMVMLQGEHMREPEQGVRFNYYQEDNLRVLTVTDEILDEACKPAVSHILEGAHRELGDYSVKIRIYQD